ncbi:MAG: hypothetical protein WBG11_04915 [Methylocella sp.]
MAEQTRVTGNLLMAWAREVSKGIVDGALYSRNGERERDGGQIFTPFASEHRPSFAAW